MTPVAAAEKEVAWDDEEDFEPAPVLSHGDAPKLSKDKEDKLAREKRAAKDAALEAALDENESEGEKRLRERRRDEDADHELSKELYGQSISGGGSAAKVVTVQGLDGYALKDLKGHIALAHDVAEAFEKKKSKANFQTKCAKEVRPPSRYSRKKPRCGRAGGGLGVRVLTPSAGSVCVAWVLVFGIRASLFWLTALEEDRVGLDD